MSLPTGDQYLAPPYARPDSQFPLMISTEGRLRWAT